MNRAHFHGLLGGVLGARVGTGFAHATSRRIGNAVGVFHHAGKGHRAAAPVGMFDELRQVNFPRECGIHGNNTGLRLAFSKVRIQLRGQFLADGAAFLRALLGGKCLTGGFCLGAKALARFCGCFSDGVQFVVHGAIVLPERPGAGFGLPVGAPKRDGV